MNTSLQGPLLTVLLSAFIAATAIAQDGPGTYLTPGEAAAFTPASALSTTGFPGKWYRRQVGFAPRGDTILTAQAGGLYPDLTCAPGLRGRHNLYVSLREVNALCGLQLKLTGDDLAYTVTPALGTAEVHTNREILVARDLPLDGRKVLLHHIGRLIYFNYLRFVPVAADDTQAQPDPQRVVREPLVQPCELWRRTRDEVPEGMQEVRHVSPPPAVAADTGSAGAVIFTRPWLELVFPDAVPAAAEVTSEVRVSAARGEYEPLSFCVYAGRDLGPCTVSVSDLRSGAAVIARGNLAAGTVALRNLRTTFDGKLYMHAPVTIEPISPVTLQGGQTRQFWLTLHVPPTAAPGVYTGTLTVTPTLAPPQRLRLRVRVWPFALREPRDVACGMYDRLAGATGEPGWLREHFAGMRRQGLTTVAYCGGLNAPARPREGRSDAIFDGSSGLEQVLAAYHAAGFPHPMLWMMSDELWSRCTAEAPPGSDAFAAQYVQAAQALLAACRRRGWQPPIFQPVDEPGSYDWRPDAALLDRWATESQFLKQAGATVEVDHIPFTTDDPRLKAPLERALPAIDIFTQRFSNRLIWFERDGWWWGNMKPEVQRRGKRLWSYNINDAAFFPELPTLRLAYGLFLWREGIKGQLLWAYEEACGNPLNCLDGAFTDLRYVYPRLPEAQEPGGPTLMWEAIREGRDDYNYLYTLRCLIEERERQGPTAETAGARQLLQKLDGSFDDERLRGANRFLECRWENEQRDPSGARIVSGGFNVPNGWTPADYDRWRTAVAEQIVRLSTGN